MKDIKKYLMHSSGFYSFINWLADIQKFGMPAEIQNEIIKINPLFSKYLSFGISSLKKSGGDPFIAIPSQEAKWMSMMSWDNIIIKKNDDHIYLIASECKSPSSIYPDIPSFAIGFYIDLKEKASLLNDVEKIVIREYFKEDNDDIYINYHNSVVKLNVKKLNVDDEIIIADSGKDYDIFIKEMSYKYKDVPTPYNY